ncbi:MAG: formate dehydrogenase accessory sulfurtransferase FdhD [Cytophagales bacterium]|nr:formate dehydrogenase accessory sulfurtransferase FdhD [Cytophagales bacterium]
MLSPYLTQARAPLTHSITATNEAGEQETVSIPAERSLTVYVDKREIVTLMTLGVNPELLVLGYLLNQKLIATAPDVESITVDWDGSEEGGVAAVKTHAGIAAIEARTARRVVTSGCGQGSIFGGLLDDIDAIKLPDARLPQAALFDILSLIRQQDTTYKSSGSVHGCALFRVDAESKAATLLHHVEDVGRHNALDTLAGWMSLQATPDKASSTAAWNNFDLVLYTTGRLTSEMVIKSAQMGVPFVVSRSGITQMGFDVATRLGLGTIGRALNTRYLCYTGAGKIER